MVAGSFRQSDRARLRHRGYLDAMAGAGLEPAEPLELPLMVSDARPALADSLAHRHRPTAFFCSNDQLAMTVMRDLARLGRRVPADASVAGFDGVQVGTLMTPPLATVVQPSQRIAATAIGLLLDLVAGRRHTGPTILDHALRLGGSIAAPSAAGAAAFPAAADVASHDAPAPPLFRPLPT
jgi:DNA-binding LacI/PurR family transcriptional regulator